MADWIDATEEQAYALGIMPDTYGRLQPHELRKLFDAHKKRQKDSDYRTAYFLSWLVNCQVQKPIDPNAIADPLYVTKEEKEEQAAEDKKILFKEFGLDKGVEVKK